MFTSSCLPSWRCQLRRVPSSVNPTFSSARTDRPFSGLAYALKRSIQGSNRVVCELCCGQGENTAVLALELQRT